MVPVGDEFDGEDLNQVTGHGYALWGRVTAVASNLTVNVSQAWQKSSRLADGEETPPGQESRLTKALKAYHLDRARSPTDLPVWLFDEHERGVAPKSWNAAKTGDFEDQFLPSNIHEPGQRGGLRDIYDQAAATSKPAGSGTRGTNGDAAPQEGSRATNRLKAIRDAKRTAIQTRSESEQLAMSARLRNENAGRESLPAAAARVGLPARPGRMKQ
ncbi:hypothetical protein K439DRAFT_99479 [Ramaria rubella]|nr:hypothetical protein K439DRAFT_99479 [Ramaria rubella]